MIVQIGLFFAIIIFGTLFGIQGTDIATGVMGEVMAPFMSMIQSAMIMLAHLSPILIAALPIWLVFRDEGTAKPMALTWGAIYGVILFGLVQFTGIDLRMVQAVQQSWSGSLIGGIGAIAQFGWGILTVATYYLAGIVLAIISVILEVVSGLGTLAKSGKSHVTRAQAGVLDRIIRRLTE